jgi:hypothetical protein
LVVDRRPQHRSKECWSHLRKNNRDVNKSHDVYFVLDNYEMRNAPEMLAHFDKHPGSLHHSIPIQAKWIDLVGRQFAATATKRILRTDFSSRRRIPACEPRFYRVAQRELELVRREQLSQNHSRNEPRAPDVRGTVPIGNHRSDSEYLRTSPDG